MLTSIDRMSILAACPLIVVMSACESASLPIPDPSPADGAAEAYASARADIALYRDLHHAGSTHAGTTSQRDVTGPEMADHLERLLARAEGPRRSFDPLMLNGGSAVTASGDPGTARTVEFSAWTHCTGCSSGSTETGGDMKMTLVQGGSYTYSSSRFGNLSPYSSGRSTMGISGVRADASITTQHYAKYASNTYTRYSSAGGGV